MFAATRNDTAAEPESGESAVSWQASVAPVLALARRTDDSLNRLLAGSYEQSSGEEMLSTLPTQIGQFLSAIRSERQAAR